MHPLVACTGVAGPDLQRAVVLVDVYVRYTRMAQTGFEIQDTVGGDPARLVSGTRWASIGGEVVRLQIVDPFRSQRAVHGPVNLCAPARQGNVCAHHLLAPQEPVTFERADADMR